MESPQINIHKLTKIPEEEFKQHFRNWMEQDDVARSLQSKLRKDLIENFNKTSLGKKIIAQTGVSHRLNLSPLLLALNALVAEFLYAQDCHFTLSVFCTEVPYRNTLPDFERVRHFRFSEREIYEILDALYNKLQTDTKGTICKEYSNKQHNYSLLFVLLKHILNQPKENEQNIKLPEDVHPKQTMPQKPNTRTTTTDKLNSRIEYQRNNFRYLNKYLMILSKKMKEMSKSLDILQKPNNTPQTNRKSLQTRKFENLNRNLEKISENLRQLSVSKRKNKRLSAVITAINMMARQFEKCVMNFEQISKGFSSAGAGAGRTGKTEKTYSDWIQDMRTTNNGKLFLEKIESSLRKALQRERKKMADELEQRLQIQKDILKTKYKQKLLEEQTANTSRAKDESSHRANEILEKKLNEFEAKHQELHLKIQEAEKKLMETPQASVQIIPTQHVESKSVRMTQETPPQAIQVLVDTRSELQEMVKNISDQERQIDHIVFDAKLRVQELEHESNQLDRSFRDYLERQNIEKQKMRENATSIWQSYALGKSMLDKKQAPHRLTLKKVKTYPVATFDRTTPALSILTINIDDVSASTNSPVFENPIRIAQRKVLSRSKTLPPPPTPPPLLLMTDTDSSVEKSTQCKSKQPPAVLRLIEHDDEDKFLTKTQPPQPSKNATKLTQVTQQSPEFNIEDITLDGIELSPVTTAKSSSVRSIESNSSARGVFKLKRQLFTVTNNGGGDVPSANNHQQTSSNGNNESEEPLHQINKENDDVSDGDGDGDGNENKFIKGHKENVTTKKESLQKMKESEQRAFEIPVQISTGVVLETPSIVLDEDFSS